MYSGVTEPHSLHWTESPHPDGVKFLVSDIMPEESIGYRKDVRGGTVGGGGGGAGNELNSGKLHLQGSPPVYNESV